MCRGYFFFFKQKTAYEMRISDWSSDVCSSDLQHMNAVGDFVQTILRPARHGLGTETQPFRQHLAQGALTGPPVSAYAHQIDRNTAFHAGLRQQHVDELVAVYAAGLGFKHKAYGCILA